MTHHACVIGSRETTLSMLLSISREHASSSTPGFSLRCPADRPHLMPKFVSRLPIHALSRFTNLRVRRETPTAPHHRLRPTFSLRCPQHRPQPNISETRANPYHRSILSDYAKECPGESIAHHTAFRSTSAVNVRHFPALL
jgi:hypothetical protein